MACETVGGMPALPENLTIRVASADDVRALDRGVPAESGGNAHRLERSLAGESALLLAFVEGDVVGRGELLWSRKEDSVRAEHPDVPELNGLDVPERWRGHGIGTALIEAAVRLAAGRGRPALGLGVASDNPAAHRLYTRLGFAGDLDYTDRYTIVHEGEAREFADTCRFLTRALP
jgi:GNAT superfamily N-acetyltransferase